jgi:dGTPase
MSIRTEFEKREKSFMSPFGCLSAESRGRHTKEKPCPVRTVFHDGQPKGRTVCDFIASMTDRYAMNLYRKIFFPSPLV